MQRALIQYRNPKNYDLVHEALTIAKRTDLIGFDKKCLIRPRKNDKDFKLVGDYRNSSGKKQGELRKDGSFSSNKTRKNKKTIRNVHKKKNK